MIVTSHRFESGFKRIFILRNASLPSRFFEALRLFGLRQFRFFALRHCRSNWAFRSVFRRWNAMNTLER
jgi:hypothetical protein